MKKLLWILPILFFSLLSCGPVPNEAQSGLIITAPDGFAINCQANYTRLTPHFCSNDNAVASIGLTSDNTCRSIGNGTVPANTRGIFLGVQQFIFSANAVALREINTTFWTDAGCTVSAGRQMRYQVREWVALVATTMFNADHSSTIERVAFGQTEIWYKSTLTSCVGCGIAVSIVGYYD